MIAIERGARAMWRNDLRAGLRDALEPAAVRRWYCFPRSATAGISWMNFTDTGLRISVLAERRFVNERLDCFQ